MVSIYYLSGFNNYYNRTILLPQATKIDDYDDFNVIKIDKVENFNPNDNVMTQLVANYWEGTDEEDGIADTTCVDYILISSDNVNVDSRWFVLDRKRIRGQQWQFTLRRDLVSDNYEAVINAPCFIEKATLPPDSPLLWNKENMAFNQIKQEETLLKDDSGCPWIVGYYAKNTSPDFLKGTVDSNDLEASYDEAITTTFENWEYNATTKPLFGAYSGTEFRIYVMKYATSIGFQQQNGYLKFDTNGFYTGTAWVSGLEAPLSANFRGSYAGAELQNALRPTLIYQLKGELKNYVSNYSSQEKVQKLLSYNGKVIKDIDGKFYSLKVVQNGYQEEVVDIKAGNLYNSLKQLTDSSAEITGTPDTNSFKVWVQRPQYIMYANPLTNLETKWDITEEKLLTSDAPYNIFAIPYGDTQLEYLGNAVATSTPSISMAVANSIIRTMGNNLYDIQLLPYCPINTPMSNGVIAIYDTKGFSTVNTPEPVQHISYILHVPLSQFSKKLNYTIDIPEDAVGKKISNECDMYRLCSPNYNGAFEFSPAKNNGVAEFNVDCQYKPYQPYIHVNPAFGGMYGSDFGDARGLICNGDFSLPQIKDAWQDYQIQNKNFQEIFSRQIENMEAQRDVQRVQEIFGSITGAVSGGASLGAMGLSLGGPVVGGITAGVGGAVSAIGGAVDYYTSEKLHSLSLDYTKDMFGYNLGNIKAIPYSLTKVSAYNNNNKIFPFIEYYTCKQEEKDAFRNKLIYNGMTVGVIGTIADYQQANPTYIKGSVIRVEGNENLDYHSLTELSNEIYKGVFI